MKITTLIGLSLWLLLIIPDANATKPSANLRNVDFNVEIVKVPEKIGDILEISWSFTLNRETDSIFRRFCEREDIDSRIKANFRIGPEQEFLSGDTEWIGNIEYGIKHSFSLVYKIKTAGKITGSPFVEIQKDVNGKWMRSTRNSGKGFMFIIKDTAAAVGPQEHIVVDGNDTIKHIVGYDFPKEFSKLDTSNIIFNLKRDSTQRYRSRPKNVLALDITAYNDGDTLEISMLKDSVFLVHFYKTKPDKYNIENSSNVSIINKTSDTFRLILNNDLKGNLITLTINDEKKIYLKIKQTWKLDGYFKLNDRWGTDSPLDRVDCFLYEWINDQWEQTGLTWTDLNGYFAHYPNEDTVLTYLWSSNDVAFVFYANDTCFDFSLFESYTYHNYGVRTINPDHVNHTIPESYTTISDLSTAGAFHILNVMKYSGYNFDYPTISLRVPMYYNNFDSCVDISRFGRFEIAGVRGIEIKGDVDIYNDWDQWDTSVILHD